MPLLVGYDLGGLEPKTRQALDHILAAIQTWAGQVDGINAAERLNELSAGISGLSTVQPGTIQAFGGPSAPTGYLLCDGSAVSRTTYANLFAAISTTWGAGNGSTTFNVPDLRGKYFFCKAAAGTGSTLGSSFGAIDHTHTGPSHTHTGPSHTHTGPNHTHTGPSHTHTGPSHTHGAGSYTTGTHNHGGETDEGDEEGLLFLDTGIIEVNFNDAGHKHPIDTQAAMAITGTSGSGGTGATGADGTGVTSASGTGDTGASGTGATSASGTGATGTANPPAGVMQAIIKT